MQPQVARADDPSEDEIRAQLEKILACDLFVNSERLCRFLRWAVEHALAGESDQLKEYALGRDVFDRDSNYDPRIDSIVRVEARRLRAKLHRYYENQGRDDAVAITFRRGSYVPNFRRAAPPPAGSPKPDRRTVAVLPFSNLSSEPDQEFFCEGVAEEILNSLASVKELRVVARASAFRFHQENLDVKEAARQLGAGTLVEGTVRRAGKRLRVSAKIVDTGTGSYIWTEIFDRELDDIFAIQNEIARAVTESLAGVMQVPHVPPPNPEAYEIYLHGRYARSRLTVEGFRRAVEYFTQAISRYPDYAQPYGALADVYARLVYRGAGQPADLGAKCSSAALAALKLDPRCTEALAALGAAVSCLDWCWQEGDQLLHRAQELQPSFVAGYLHHAFCQAQTGDLPLAIATARKGIELDPLSVQAHRMVGYLHYLDRQYGTALAWWHRALELAPKARHTYFFMAEAKLRMGRAEEAIASYRKSQDVAPYALGLGGLCEALTAAGRRKEAEGVVSQIEAMAEQGRAFAPALVYAYAGLNDSTSALKWLEKACDDHWTGILALKRDPKFDSLRPHSRFQAILDRMNLSSGPPSDS